MNFATGIFVIPKTPVKNFSRGGFFFHYLCRRMVQAGFGEYLRQAREAQGLTLKQVESEIKIREDYLHNFECSNYNIPLPDVYKRGFVRTYAEFLQLDVKKILAMLPAEVDPEDVPSPVADKKFTAKETLKAPEEQRDTEIKLPHTLAENIKEKFMDRRWQVSIGGALLLLIVAFFQLRPAKHSEWDVLLQGEPSDVVSVAAAVAKKLKITATDNVQVLVREKDTKQKIFSAHMKKGATEIIEQRGNLQISFSEGTALAFEKESGEQVKPKKPGVGWLELTY